MNNKTEYLNKLSQESINAYLEDGYLLLPGYFSPAQIADIRSGLPQIVEEKTERTIYETDGKTIRSVYAIHQNSQVFSKLARQPMLLQAARQVLGGDVYVYQSKINWKLPFAGTTWDWHQDFTFWHCEDAMPTPRATNVTVFLDEVNEFNGPIYIVPGSHKNGIYDYSPLTEKPAGYEDAPSWISNLTEKLKYSIERDRLAELIKHKGITAPKGPAGSVLIFDSNLIHASPPNITPFNRTTVMFSYNRVDNAPPESKRRRPDFLSSSDSRPLEVDSSI